MTATATTPKPPPHLVWINGPPGAWQRQFAWYLRDTWGFPVFDADGLGDVLKEGLPAPMDVTTPDELAVWHNCVSTLSVGLAQAWPPMLVMPITLYDTPRVTQLLDAQRRDVEVVHAVMVADEDYLRDRIHRRIADRDAKRRALQSVSPALTGLARVPDSVQLDLRQPAARLSDQLLSVLYGKGWLTPDGEWARAV